MKGWLNPPSTPRVAATVRSSAARKVRLTPLGSAQPGWPPASATAPSPLPECQISTPKDDPAFGCTKLTLVKGPDRGYGPAAARPTGPAPVDRDGDAGDVVAVRRGQEEGNPSDLVRLAGPAQRDY